MATARGAPPGFFPLDRELGLAAGSPWSNRAREIVVRIGAMVPFEQGPALVAMTAGLRISVSTMRTLTEAAGAVLVEAETREREWIEQTLPEAPVGAARQQVSVDGAMVPLVGGEWREARTLAIGVIEAAADGERTTTALSYLSRLTTAEAFSREAIREVHRRGTEHAAVIAAVADGALWCQQVFDDHVPRSVRILDFPHAVEHLSSVAQAVFGSGTAATSEWLGTQRHTLQTGDPDVVLAAIAAVPVGSASNPAEAAQIRDRELAYFTTRRAQIDYAQFAAQGLPIGSGAVESANKVVVEARLKGAGMHWSPAHVDGMLSLRCAICSNQWATAWRLVNLPPRAPASIRPVTPPARPEHVAPVTTEPRIADIPPTPRPAPTIVNRRPTSAHPWKRGFNLRNPRTSAIDR